MVEGHTDNVPISSARAQNNWELSVLRATAVVQMLKDQHGIAPGRLVAAGRGEFQPIADNATAEGRARNRRTRIIILPKLNEFFDLLDPNKVPK
ncbi:MAG: OmpA family protein [Bacteroidota bacterium]